LVPVSLCDLLLRAASAGLFRLVWSDEILAEVERAMVEAGLTSPVKASRRVDEMRTHFPEAIVGDYDDLVANLTTHPEDRHVLAAAIKGQARTIVTANLKDFPPDSVRPYRISVRSPDAFLCEMFECTPNDLAEIVRRQAQALNSPPIPVERLLGGIAKHAPDFVARIGPLVHSDH
jgi:predicted nucleic acid-binding protein